MGKIIMLAARLPELGGRVNDFCKNYFDDFGKNKNDYIKQHNYHGRIVAALMAADHLEQVAKKQKNTKLAEFYADKQREYKNERTKLLKRKRW